MKWSIRLAVIGLVALGAGLVSLNSEAQNYPTRTIRFVVPWPPGGGTDVLARAIGQSLSKRLGQPVVVENKPGAAGIIGANDVAKSAPDGYTIMMATITLASNPPLYRSIPFDAEKDFAPISLVAGVPHVLAVNPSVKAHSVKELIALAKANPAKLNYASAGLGSPFYLAAELFQQMAGVKFTHVPYKGGGPAITATLSGEVQLTFGNLIAVLPFVKSGKLRALGITSAKRSPAAPGIPTIAESGLPGYEFTSWFGIFAPAGTPKPIITKLNHEIVSILHTPEMQKRLSRAGADLIASSPEQFTNYLKSETLRWAKVLKQAGVKPGQ